MKSAKEFLCNTCTIIIVTMEHPPSPPKVPPPESYYGAPSVKTLTKTTCSNRQGSARKS